MFCLLDTSGTRCAATRRAQPAAAGQFINNAFPRVRQCISNDSAVALNYDRHAKRVAPLENEVFSFKLVRSNNRRALALLSSIAKQRSIFAWQRAPSLPDGSTVECRCPDVGKKVTGERNEKHVLGPSPPIHSIIRGDESPPARENVRVQKIKADTNWSALLNSCLALACP